MKKTIAALALFASFSSFAAPIDAICLSSDAKENGAVVTTMKFDLEDKTTAMKTEIAVDGSLISEKTLSIIALDVLTDSEGETIYFLMDEEAEFYNCAVL